MRSETMPHLHDDGELTGKKILIADDDPTTHIKFRKFLENLGFQVLHAYDGTEALTMARKLRPDLLLLDISMPNMDGRDVCKWLKGEEDTSRVRIIMFTGRDTANDRLVSLELGADEYIEKPCTPYYLERTIKFLLRPGK